MDVLLVLPGGRGWGPIQRLATLAAMAFEGQLIQVSAQELPGRGAKIRMLMPAPTRSGGGELLVIAPIPEHLNVILQSGLRGRYRRTIGWVIDSFWHERIPRVVSTRGWFTRLYVTDASDHKPWSERSAVPVGVLPWGSDVLNAGVSWSGKAIDLLRMGRQPDSWDDDDRTQVLLQQRNSSLVFAGRPPFGQDDQETYHFALEAYGRAKVVLAFSNTVHSATYTHPEREYVTGRWTDAIASGCLVAGVVPDTEAAALVVPKIARITVSPNDLNAGLNQIVAALGEYTKERYLHIRRHAAEYVDWHHRFVAICKDLNIPVSANLTLQLANLHKLADTEAR